MILEVVDTFGVVTIVDLDLELLVFLEEVCNFNWSDELGIQVVFHHLSLPNFRPSQYMSVRTHVTAPGSVFNLLEQYNEGVGLGESVHVFKIFSLESQFDRL